MLIFVRHGRTAANASGLLLGHADPPLDSFGAEQAAAVAAHLGGVDMVVSSPLTRARQTAETIAAEARTSRTDSTRGTVIIDDRFIELDYGDWDQTPARGHGAETWAAWRSDLDFAPPGGESLLQLSERVRPACAEWAERACEQRIVIVSHVSPIKAAVAWALGVGDEAVWKMFLAPASITRIECGDRGPILWSFNEQVEVG